MKFVPVQQQNIIHRSGDAVWPGAWPIE
eukprot:SAG31_NODE_33216_length_346_cov_1.052632_2_plen_27_part_01